MKNRKIISRLLKISLIGFCALNLSPVFAADSDDYTALSSTGCTNNANCTAEGFSGGFSGAVQALLFQPSYNQERSMAAGSILGVIFNPNATALASDSKVSKSVLSLISNKGNVAADLLANTTEIFAENYVLVPGATSAKSLFSGIPFLGGNRPATAADNQFALNSLSFDGLITPMVYLKSPPISASGQQDSSKDNVVDQLKAADTFIQYVTGLANPMRAADFSATKLPTDGKYLTITSYLADLQKKPEVRDYLTALRTYTAQLSVGISNFYYLYNERLPTTDPTVLKNLPVLLGTPSLGRVQLPSTPVSPLQIEQIIATRRVNDPNWYTAMQNALPSTLLRESLFVLAEIPPMLFQIHLDLERILATMSAMQIQQVNSNRLMLEGQRDKVDKILQSPEESKSETQQAIDEANKQATDEQIEAAQKAVNPANK